MSVRANVICPKCASRSCRESRWLSRQEKIDNAGARPQRCLDCGHRFLFSPPSVPSSRRLGLAIAVATTVVLGLAGLLLFKAADEPDDDTFSSAYSTASNPNGSASPSDMERLLAAAREGDADAQFRIGRKVLLDHSRGAEGADEAVAWLRKAADQGHPGAMLQLGKLYRSGIGLTQNYALAAQWIQAAAGAGHDESMVELGRLYRSGIGVERDPIQAYIWFNRAAAARNMEGVAERDSIALKLTPQELSHAQHHSLPSATAILPDSPPAAEPLQP